MIQEGKVYEFNVVQMKVDTKGYDYIELERDGIEYRVYPTQYQTREELPKKILCYVKKTYQPNGNTYLEQNPEYILPEVYEEGTEYDFTVVREASPSASGFPRYLVQSIYGLYHVYTSFDNSTYKIGDIITRKIRFSRNAKGTLVINFYDAITDFDKYEPRTLFNTVGLNDYYDKYYSNLERIISADVQWESLLQEIRGQVEDGERLWVFSYISLLDKITYSCSEETVDILKECSYIIKAIETWLLEKSGILTSFSPIKKKDTIAKAETQKKRADINIKAADIITNGEQKTYFQTILNALKTTSYIPNREETLSVMFKLLVIDQSLIEEDIESISQIIELTSDDVYDTEIRNRIVNILISYINQERKRINALLHFQRSQSITPQEIHNLLVGMGTLLNMYADDGSQREVRDNINARQLFPSLCKYLAYNATKDKASMLLDAALRYMTNTNCVVKVDGSLLRESSASSERLIEQILRLRIPSPENPMYASSETAYILYKGGKLIISPTSYTKYKGIHEVAELFEIPGTPLIIGSIGTEVEPWELNKPVSYYKEKWIGLFENVKDARQNTTRKTLIKVKNNNSKYPGLIFCKTEDDSIKEDGVISISNYTQTFFIDDIRPIFKHGMILPVDVIRTVKNGEKRVNYNIIDTIHQFSYSTALKQTDSCRAVCLSFKYGKGYLITENGILCKFISTDSSVLQQDETYNVIILNQSDWDRGMPTVMITGVSSEKGEKNEFLKNQLCLISEEYLSNGNTEQIETERVKTNHLPYLLLVIDNYLRLTDDLVIRYNIYQLARLVALVEHSKLSSYYSFWIKYIETTSDFLTGNTPQSSIPEVEHLMAVLSNFPSLKEQEERLNLIKSFGNEEDINYLYDISFNENKSSLTKKIAKLSLASKLLSDIDNSANAQNEIKRLLISDYGIKGTDKNIEISPEEIDSQMSPSTSNIITNFGLENQIQEFKTSIVIPAGKTTPDPETQLFVILKAINGFLNSHGGNIFIGVNDNGIPVGIEQDLKILSVNNDGYERYIRAAIVRAFNKDINGTIDIDFMRYNSVEVCKISVPEYFKPIALQDEFYQRQGTEVRILKGEDLILFIRRKGYEKQLGNTQNVLSDTIIPNPATNNNQLEEVSIPPEVPTRKLMEPEELTSELFSQASTTYKHFWFLALLDMIKNNKTEFSLLEMAAVMMSKVWKLVIQQRVYFGKVDETMQLASRLQALLDIPQEANSNTVYRIIAENINNDDVRDILVTYVKSVPGLFLSPWINDSNYGVIESRSQSYENNCLYAITGVGLHKKVIINQNWTPVLAESNTDLKKLTLQYLAKFLEKKNNDKN